MVLECPVRKAGRLSESLAFRVPEECQNADVDSAGRRRHRGPARAKPGTLSRTKTLWRGNAACRLSARTARPARRKTSGGPLEPRAGLVRQTSEVNSAEVRERQRARAFLGPPLRLPFAICASALEYS